MRIELRDVGLKYEGRTLFSDLHLSVSQGEFVVVRGPSGCGKSSLLRLITRLQEPTTGSIWIDGRPGAEAPVTSYRRRGVYLAQTPVMVAGSVGDNLTFPFRFDVADRTAEPTTADLEVWLADFMLDHLRIDSDAERLSGGEQQRIALIRTLLVGPDIILCDEPASALEADSGSVVRSHLEEAVTKEGRGVVLVEHSDYKPATSHRELSFARDGTLEEVPA